MPIVLTPNSHQSLHLSFSTSSMKLRSPPLIRAEPVDPGVSRYVAAGFHVACQAVVLTPPPRTALYILRCRRRAYLQIFGPVVGAAIGGTLYDEERRGHRASLRPTTACVVEFTGIKAGWTLSNIP